MTVVSDSSPLITLSKLGCLELLQHLYQTIAITPEVYHEVVVAGAGLKGAAEVAASKWIRVMPIQHPAGLVAIQLRFGLGLGELSAIMLAVELNADLRNLLSDLRRAYRELLSAGAYLDRGILENSLKTLNLPPL